MFDIYSIKDILRQMNFFENLMNVWIISMKYIKKNIDDFINDQLNCVRICSMRVNENDDEQSLKNEYSEKSQRIIYYLITLVRFTHLN